MRRSRAHTHIASGQPSSFWRSRRRGLAACWFAALTAGQVVLSELVLASLQQCLQFSAAWPNMAMSVVSRFSKVRDRSAHPHPCKGGDESTTLYHHAPSTIMDAITGCCAHGSA
eukprot:4184259-Pleurochrysis_carterae.AAC.2